MRSVNIIYGSKTRKRQLVFELQSLRVFEKRSTVTTLNLQKSKPGRAFYRKIFFQTRFRGRMY